MMRNPTQQVLKNFFAAKNKALTTFRSLLETQGYMGYEFIDSISLEELPPTIRNFILALKTGSLSDTLNAIDELDYSEAVNLDDKTLKVISLLPSQCITRSQSGYSFVKRVIECPILFTNLFGTSPDLLELLPKDWQPIDYAAAKDYGGFILSLKEGNSKEFLKYVERLSPISLPA